MVKSADLLANTSEILADYRKDGDDTFQRFNAPKAKFLTNYIETIEILIDHWSGNPFIKELSVIVTEFKKINSIR